MSGHPYPCDACGERSATGKRWVKTPLGLSVIWACSDACAEVARRERDGRFVTLGPAKGVVPRP